MAAADCGGCDAGTEAPAGGGRVQLEARPNQIVPSRAFPGHSRTRSDSLSHSCRWKHKPDALPSSFVTPANIYDVADHSIASEVKMCEPLEKKNSNVQILGPNGKWAHTQTYRRTAPPPDTHTPPRAAASLSDYPSVSLQAVGAPRVSQYIFKSSSHVCVRVCVRACVRPASEMAGNTVINTGCVFAPGGGGGGSGGTVVGRC